MSVASVRSAFGTALRTISGLNVDEYIAEGIRPPHAMVDCEIDYDLTFARGAHTYRFIVLLWMFRSDPEQSQKSLDVLRDPEDSGGIKQTLEGNATLAAAVDYVRVVRVGRPQIATVGNTDYLLVEFEVEVVL